MTALIGEHRLHKQTILLIALIEFTVQFDPGQVPRDQHIRQEYVPFGSLLEVAASRQLFLMSVERGEADDTMLFADDLQTGVCGRLLAELAVEIVCDL